MQCPFPPEYSRVARHTKGEGRPQPGFSCRNNILGLRMLPLLVNLFILFAMHY